MREPLRVIPKDQALILIVLKARKGLACHGGPCSLIHLGVHCKPVVGVLHHPTDLCASC